MILSCVQFVTGLHTFNYNLGGDPMNKYERGILLNTFIMKVLYVILLLVNLFLPTIKNTYFHFSILQIVVIIMWLFGLLGGLGYFNQYTPILSIGIIRIIEIGYALLFKFKVTNWIAIGVFILIDIIFTVFLLLDKASYAYVTEEDKDVE